MRESVRLNLGLNRKNMDDYAYTNARIRAMEGRLLSRDQYDSLLAQATLDGLVHGLRSLPYARALEPVLATLDRAQGLRTIGCLDEALRRDLVETLGILRGFFSDRSRELLDVLLLRWDVYNLKTVLRGKRAAAPIEEVLAMTFPVGLLDDIAVAELARAPTMQAVAHLLEMWRLPLARPVRSGLDQLGEADDLQPLESELDRLTLLHSCRLAVSEDENDRAVGSYLGFLADSANLLAALRYLAERGARSSLEAGRHFLEAGGRFTRTRYEAVIGAPDLREGLNRLVATSFGWLTDLFRAKDSVSPPLVERELNRAAIRKSVALSRPDPLGIGPAIAYLERKTNEIRNLRMILRGKVAGMQPEQVEEWLILWPI
ncbi:MAG: V-type ATPase subunit [Nitrospiraceae bacterium]